MVCVSRRNASTSSGLMRISSRRLAMAPTVDARSERDGLEEFSRHRAVGVIKGIGGRVATPWPDHVSEESERDYLIVELPGVVVGEYPAGQRVEQQIR